MIAFINASPLIYLGKLGLLEHLPKLYNTIITNSVVKNELLADSSAPEHTALQIAFSSWLTLKDPEDAVLLGRLEQLNIHAGEAGVIALAQESKSQNILIIDDLNARDISRTLGIRVMGTLGMLLEFLKEELITSEEAKQKLKLLVDTTTFRISTKLYSNVLEKLEAYKNMDGHLGHSQR
nr:DUF3368 domain-containing protein [Candidatus Sigynarchaeota archaeon]